MWRQSRRVNGWYRTSVHIYVMQMSVEEDNKDIMILERDGSEGGLRNKVTKVSELTEQLSSFSRSSNPDLTASAMTGRCLPVNSRSWMAPPQCNNQAVEFAIPACHNTHFAVLVISSTYRTSRSIVDNMIHIQSNKARAFKRQCNNSPSQSVALGSRHLTCHF